MTLGPLIIGIEGRELTAADAERLRHPLVGGVILFARNIGEVAETRALIEAVHALRDDRLLVTVDQEGGRVQRFRDGFHALPPLRWLGHQHDLDAAHGRHLAHACGWLMAAELREIGVDLSFAPCVDLDHGTSSVIGDRALHRDPEVVSVLATAWLQGMRRAGMAACAKHFPGHGFVVADSHHELPVDGRSRDEMLDDLLPYERLIDHGLTAIMVAHVRYPAISPEVASLSPYWMRGELRDRFGFRGAILSDDLGMQALAGEGDAPTCARRALDAGADMVLLCNDMAATDAVLDALGTRDDAPSQGRRVMLRPQPAALAGALSESGGLRHSHEWQQAVRLVDEARQRPPLALDG